MSDLTKPITTTRRDFCASCSKSAALLAIAGVTGCGGGGPTSPSASSSPLSAVSATVAGRAVTVSIGASSPLASVGSMAIVQTSLGNFLLTRTGATTVSVLTATCTHEGCTITGFSGSNFVCPCHGSTFTASGSVVTGPANRSLQQFNAQLTDGIVTFTA